MFSSTVFVTSDIKAMGAMKSIQESGFNIPDDISVVGYDDIPGAGNSSPPLTTIRGLRYEMGVEAVKIIDALNKGIEEKLPIKKILPMELITRQSTGRYYKKNRH